MAKARSPKAKAPTAGKPAKPARTSDTKVVAPTSVDLAALTAALARKDGAGALDAALAAWRTCRAPALADLIDAISTRISGSPITDDDEWNRVSTGKDRLALGRLLAGIRELPVSSLPTAAMRLTVDDPRVASAARDWILDPPCTSTSAYPFWTKLLDHLGKLGDTRLRPAIAKRIKMKPPAQHAPWMRNPKPSQFWGKYYKALEALDDKLAAIVVPPIDAKPLAKLDKPIAALSVVEAGARAGSNKASGQAKGPPLARAVALVPTDPKAAIDALLEAWRAKRAPEIANLIDRASRLLPSHRRALPPGDKPGHAAWKAAFAEDPLANLPLLLHGLHTGGSTAAVEHISDLATLPDDPRIALRITEVARGTISAEKAGYWKTAWALIARIADTRVIAPLRASFNDFTGTYYDHHKSGKRIVGDFVLSPPPPSPLDATDHKALNQIATALAKAEATAAKSDQERQLIADIVNNWSDDGPRLVYADWLTEREHPRGELIVLGCKQQRTKAEETRWKQLAPGWRTRNCYYYGPISDLAFELDRGLPSAVHYEFSSSTITLRHLAGDPLLALIEAVQIEEAYDDRRTLDPADLAAVMNDPGATRLTRVTGVHEDDKGRLASELEPLVAAGWKRSGKDFARR